MQILFTNHDAKSDWLAYANVKRIIIFILLQTCFVIDCLPINWFQHNFWEIKPSFNYFKQKNYRYFHVKEIISHIMNL